MKRSADLTALVDAHSAARAQLSDYAQQAVARTLTGFTGWYDPQAVQATADALTRTVESAQRRTASLTDAYLSRATGALRGRTVPGVGAVDVTSLRADVEHAAVYARPAETYRWAVSQGKTPSEALSLAVQRGRTLAATDVTLAFRAQTHTFAEQRDLTGYRRVIRPELAAGLPCPLCIGTADRTYGPDDPMPLHNRCNCSALPVVGDQDPAAALNRADITAATTANPDLHEQIRTTPAVVRHHGELGPVLTDGGDHFRGPAAVAAAS